MAGEGFPWWIGLTADDRLMTSLPLFHVNAPAYSVLGSVAARASLVLLPRFSASGFLDSARRHGATEFNAIGAMIEILMRQPERPDDADNPLRLAYTGPAPPKERHLEIERRFGLEMTSGYAMSETTYGTVWRARHAAVRHARLAAPAPDARRGERGARERGRRARAAQPRGDEGLLGDARGDRGGARPRRLAQDRRPRDGEPGRHLHVRRAARRRSSGGAARTWRPRRSRRRSRRIRTWWRPRWWACRRSSPRRRSRRSW